MMYGKVGGECWGSGCHKEATHVLHFETRIREDDEYREDSTAYCLDDALYFYAWLPYCYGENYINLIITPTFQEWRDAGMG